MLSVHNSIHSLYCAGKANSLVVRNDFSTLHSTMIKLHNQLACDHTQLLPDTMLPGRVLNLHCTEVQCREHNIVLGVPKKVNRILKNFLGDNKTKFIETLHTLHSI